MNREVLNREQIRHILLDEARDIGERVWDINIYSQDVNIPSRRYVFSKPLLSTTQLARDFTRSTPASSEPDSWVVARPSPSEWRLYLRVGETYSESGSQTFTSPVKVAVRSDTDFLRLLALPKEEWWQAPFSCPFCEALYTGDNPCQHLLIGGHLVLPAFRDQLIAHLFRAMWSREFNCSIHNARIDGLVIKLPRVNYSTEWFRFAHWYIRDSSIIKLIESEMAAFAKLAVTAPIGSV